MRSWREVSNRASQPGMVTAWAVEIKSKDCNEREKNDEFLVHAPMIDARKGL